MKQMVLSFIGGQKANDYNADENTDYNLSITCDEGLRPVNHYYWNNKEPIPKGVERLLKIFGVIFVDFTFSPKSSFLMLS